jgi:hypothetical protein
MTSGAMVLRTAGGFTLVSDVSDLNDTVDHIRSPRSARLRRCETQIGLDVDRSDAVTPASGATGPTYGG